MRIALLACLVICLSCNQYQYFTVSGPESKKNETNDLVVENDTVRVTYRFKGYNGPVNITIFNKSDEAVEINWKKSALVMKGVAYSYYSPDMYLRGHRNYDSIARSERGLRRPDINADIYVDEASLFIPPKASVTKVPLQLPVEFHYDKSFETMEGHTLSTAGSGFSTRVKKLTFEDHVSPVHFRSYLSFSLNGDPHRAFVMDNSFYVSEIWLSGKGPYALQEIVSDRGDLFHVIR